MVSMVSAATVSSNTFTILAQPVTLEDIIAEIDALNERLDDLETDITALDSALSSLIAAVDTLQSQLDSLSATTATTAELAILDSALDSLSDLVNE